MCALPRSAPWGRAIQLGIGLHKGELLGRANQLAMLAFCLATIVLSVSAGVMWWKRPPVRSARRAAAAARRPGDGGVTGLVLGLGALFPAHGLAILALIGLDLGARALIRPRACARRTNPS